MRPQLHWCRRPEGAAAPQHAQHTAHRGAVQEAAGGHRRPAGCGAKHAPLDCPFLKLRMRLSGHAARHGKGTATDLGEVTVALPQLFCLLEMRILDGLIKGCPIILPRQAFILPYLLSSGGLHFSSFEFLTYFLGISSSRSFSQTHLCMLMLFFQGNRGETAT